MKLFVPGRICLFGEHTDWAGGYRRINAAVVLGRCSREPRRRTKAR